MHRSSFIVHRVTCILRREAFRIQIPGSELQGYVQASGLRIHNDIHIHSQGPGLALMPHADLPGSHRCWCWYRYWCRWQGRGILAFCQSFRFPVFPSVPARRTCVPFLSFHFLPCASFFHFLSFVRSFVPFALLTSVFATFLPTSLPSCLWWQHSITRVDAGG